MSGDDLQIRLARIVKQSQQHLMVSGLFYELESCIALVQPILARDSVRQQGCKKGGSSKHKTKLPSRETLLDEAVRLVTQRLIPAKSVRKVLAQKYGVTPQAVGKVLRKTETN